MQPGKNTLTVLGCGASAGCPVLGCDCAVCMGTEPKNKRQRTAAWLQYEGRSLLVDTGPDFKYQALRAGIKQVDAVLYTHPHSDHINGIDDLRAFCYRQQEQIPLYGSQFTMAALTQRFNYCFAPPALNWVRPSLQAHELQPGVNHLPGFDLTFFELPHGAWYNGCYRFADLAWLPDVNLITDDVITTYLQDLDYLFLDCLMYKPTPSHLSVEAALAYAARIGAKETYLTHLSHLLDYETLSNECPPGVKVAYDGLKINF